MLCFLAAVGVLYLLLRRYFDARLAFWAAVMTLLSDFCWEFTLSGLPQMLMLLLFNLALYALARAIETQHAARNPLEAAGVTFRPAEIGLPTENVLTSEALGRTPSDLAPLPWLALAGVLFGLLALSHALALWLLAGAAVFCALFFRRRALAVTVLVLACALLFTPWLARNYRVCGNPFGVACYAVFDGIATSTDARMRSYEGPQLTGISPRFFRPKIQAGIINQIRLLSQNLGGNPLALMFFISLLHPFRQSGGRQSALGGAARCGPLLLVGMAFLGNTPETPAVSANQLGLLFLPIMLGYGLAFVLVLFARLDVSTRSIARVALFALLLLISGLPMIFRVLPDKHLPYQYPPYLEPVIALINGWTEDQRGDRLRHALGGGLVRGSQKPLDPRQVPRFDGHERQRQTQRTAGGVVHLAGLARIILQRRDLQGRDAGIRAADARQHERALLSVPRGGRADGRSELHLLQRHATLGKNQVTRPPRLRNSPRSAQRTPRKGKRLWFGRSGSKRGRRFGVVIPLARFV